jgi:hypothetical protein
VAVKTASGNEAAAVAAAIARFEAEMAPPPAEVAETISAWQRAALIEGVSAKESVLEAEGGSRWLS